MTSFNKVILIGNLTRDPEMRYTPNGTAVTTLALAVNRRYRQGEENREETTYVDVVVFGRQAETCSQYLSKGSGVVVDGRLSQRRWEADDGTKRSKHEVVAQEVRFLPRREGAAMASGETGRPAAGASANVGPPDFTDDDIPF